MGASCIHGTFAAHRPGHLGTAPPGLEKEPVDRAHGFAGPLHELCHGLPGGGPDGPFLIRVEQLTTHDLPFEFCIDTPINGTINGMWHYYGPADNAVFVDFPPGVGNYSGMAAGWALDVLSANDGEVWAQNAYVFHNDTWNPAQGFVYSSTSYITGGTGKYAGATGWFGFVGSDSKGGIIHGEICTP